MNYVARAVVPAEKRYLNCSKEEAVVPLSHCLYNIDKVRAGDKVIIVEGVMDALKVEKVLKERAVAIFSKQMKPAQKLLLIEKGVGEVNVMLDRDAWVETLHLTSDLAGILHCPIHPTFLTIKDPGELR